MRDSRKEAAAREVAKARMHELTAFVDEGGLGIGRAADSPMEDELDGSRFQETGVGVQRTG